jgi:hypothetical protein
MLLLISSVFYLELLTCNEVDLGLKSLVSGQTE